MSEFEFEEIRDLRIRNFQEILKEQQDNEDHNTSTSIKQHNIEADVLKLYSMNKDPVLTREKHISFLKNSLTHLSAAYECLDCSRPWLCYWILNSLKLLEANLTDEDCSKIIAFLDKCQSPNGGFGGGPGQYPHLATTYAAVNALCIIGTREAYNIIDRQNLQKFLLSMRDEDGAFSMHANGETDIRGAYCAISVALLTNVYTSDMFKGTEDWIATCQTWEGGFGGCPGMEAHGGYTFCGLAGLVLLGKTELCHVSSLLRWLANKQMRLEGGFQGRTNKLVDGCYSFWQGGAFPLINIILLKEKKVFNSKRWLFDQQALQEYILICSQDPNGGFLDKPGTNRDMYHTCYVLSGLSVAQHSTLPSIIGSSVNTVVPIHPVYIFPFNSVKNALDYFGALPVPG